jgi:hypothetical protein
MSLTLYDVSVPAFLRGFANLSRNLDKGRAYAAEQGMAESDLLEARLYPDMATLIGQVQRASDASKFTVTRVGLVENVAMPDEEKSFDDLQARIANTVAMLKTVPPASMADRDAAPVELKTAGGAMSFTARDYVLGFALPNFYFHVTTAYAIMRHKGVPLGKMDFIGRP